MHPKMSPSPLQRAAAVDGWQSTGPQGRPPPESGRRHYALADRARALGCVPGGRLEEEGGRRGAGRQQRPGGGPRVLAVCAGRRGAGVALEASRGARNPRDWHHRMALGALPAPL
jgi:hypothetical protein